jgi:hypothetical protein
MRSEIGLHMARSQDLFRNAPCSNGSVPALLASRRNRCRARRSKRRASGDFDQLRRAVTLEHADAMPSLRSLHIAFYNLCRVHGPSGPRQRSRATLRIGCGRLATLSWLIVLPLNFLMQISI